MQQTVVGSFSSSDPCAFPPDGAQPVLLITFDAPVIFAEPGGSGTPNVAHAPAAVVTWSC